MDVELSNTVGPDSISVCFLPGSSFQDFNNARAWHQKMKPSMTGAVDLIETAAARASHKCSFSPRESQAMLGPNIPPPIKQYLGLTQSQGATLIPFPVLCKGGFEPQRAVCTPFPLLSSAFPLRPLSSSCVAVCSGNYDDVLWELLSWRDDDDEFPRERAAGHVPDAPCTIVLPRSSYLEHGHGHFPAIQDAAMSHRVTSCGHQLPSTPPAPTSL